MFGFIKTQSFYYVTSALFVQRPRRAAVSGRKEINQDAEMISQHDATLIVDDPPLPERNKKSWQEFFRVAGRLFRHGY